MIFPKYIKKNDTIAVTAPSNGITDEIKIKRFNKGVEQLKNRGYNVEFTDSVFKADKRGVSNTAKIRAEEFNRLFDKNEGVKIEVKNLSYQYDSFSQPIFSNLNITIQRGESVALVGPSGIGKTTLLKVMCGLLSPTNGDVLVDNLNVNKIGLNNYRLSTACVLQEDRLFSGSIMENISGFEDNVDEEFVIECARHSNIHDEIMSMPMGYETLIGELGSGISGGQKQRLLIARALYRKPCILFMDEATSHLDLNNESSINNAISKLSITRIIVAHRPSTIASADRVIDLSECRTTA